MNRSSSNNRSRTNKPFSIVKIFSELKEEEGTSSSSFLRSKFTDLQEEEEEMTLESGETLSPGSPTASLSSSSSSSLQWAEDVSLLYLTI
jgi:hypothetical protein